MPTFWKQDTNKIIKITTADRWFSYYTRLVDSNGNGYVQCVTCKKWFFWKYVQCGHFVTREKPATRFNEQNCNPQCESCNCFHDGEQGKHALAIDKKYGSGTAQRLVDLGDIRGQKVHDQYTLKLISDEYRLKAKALAKERGLEIRS